MKLTKGHYQAFTAYVIWGFFPIYWKFLKHLLPLETLFHRIIWGSAFLGTLVFLYKKSDPRIVFGLLKKHFYFVLTLGLLIAGNWLIYVYAVNTGQILQGSLAYFITPLLNIVLGSYVFQEKLSRDMMMAAGVAGFGVLILMFLNSSFPWVALGLALTFSFYGVLKKKVHLGGLESSFLESFVMLCPVLAMEMLLRSKSDMPLMASDWALLVGAGIITAIPILLFSLSTRSIPFNHVGILQFVSPTLQFIVGYTIYGEPVSSAKWWAFAFVWIGAGLYLREIFHSQKSA